MKKGGGRFDGMGRGSGSFGGAIGVQKFLRGGETWGFRVWYFLYVDL